MMTRLTMPLVNGRRSILTGSLPATHAAVPSATAAALPQVTMPHSAPVSSAKLTKWRDASATAARTCGSIKLPPCIVRTLQQLMKGRTPRARYGFVLVFMGTSETGGGIIAGWLTVWRSDSASPGVCSRGSALKEDRAMRGQKQEAEDRSPVQSDGGGGDGTLLNSRQATEAIGKLRSGIDQASRAMHDL